MDTQKVDMFLMTNSKYFEGHQVHMIREQLPHACGHEWQNPHTAYYRDCRDVH